MNLSSKTASAGWRTGYATEHQNHGSPMRLNWLCPLSLSLCSEPPLVIGVNVWSSTANIPAILKSTSHAQNTDQNDSSNFLSDQQREQRFCVILVACRNPHIFTSFKSAEEHLYFILVICDKSLCMKKHVLEWKGMNYKGQNPTGIGFEVEWQSRFFCLCGVNEEV